VVKLKALERSGNSGNAAECWLTSIGRAATYFVHKKLTTSVTGLNQACHGAAEFEVSPF
jgi:hypothetical protein